MDYRLRFEAQWSSARGRIPLYHLWNSGLDLRLRPRQWRRRCGDGNRCRPERSRLRFAPLLSSEKT